MVRGTNADSCDDKHCEICLIGAGGGLLAMFFHEHFKNTVIDTIDLDEEMLKIAKTGSVFVKQIGCMDMLEMELNLLIKESRRRRRSIML